MKSILIAGGAGFIGSHLCQNLIKSGHQVVCLDNLITGQFINLKKLLTHNTFKFVHLDVTELKDQLNSYSFEYIFNLACPASPSQYKNYPIKTLKTSLQGSLNLLELSKAMKAKYIFTSTSEVYGEPDMHPQKENLKGRSSTTSLRACYTEGKRSAETLSYLYHSQGIINATILRIFNTYGPQMSKNDGRAVSEFIQKALKNEPLTINGNGEQTRSFCYIDDLITGILKIVDIDHFGPFNIGSPFEITIKALAEKIISLCDSKSNIVYTDKIDGDPVRRKPCLETIQSTIEWKPETSLDNGLKKTIDYFI